MATGLTENNLISFNKHNQDNPKHLPSTYQSTLLNLSHSFSNCNTYHNQVTKHKSNDEFCHICNEWCYDNKDLLSKFVGCIVCTNSYHIHCINTNYPEIKCHEIQQRCNKNRNYKQMNSFKFINDQYSCKYYQYQDDQKIISEIDIDLHSNPQKKVHW